MTERKDKEQDRHMWEVDRLVQEENNKRSAETERRVGASQREAKGSLAPAPPAGGGTREAQTEERQVVVVVKDQNVDREKLTEAAT